MPIDKDLSKCIFSSQKPNKIIMIKKTSQGKTDKSSYLAVRMGRPVSQILSRANSFEAQGSRAAKRATPCFALFAAHRYTSHDDSDNRSKSKEKRKIKNAQN